MKMYQFRVIASLVLAIFLTSIGVVFIAWACDSYKRAVEARERDVEDAQEAVDAIKEKGLMSYISDGTWKGMLVGGVSGFTVGLKAGLSTAPLTGGISVKAGVIGGVGIGAVSGGLSSRVGSAIDYYDDLSAAEDNLAKYRRKLAEAEQALEDCLNPPAKYTYDCPTCKTKYEFDPKDYGGSDEDAYNAYMNFIGYHVH